jgi:hypothetical protein
MIKPSMFLKRPRYRYTCPHCAFRLPRKHFMEDGIRPCDGCGRPIKPTTNNLMTQVVAWGFVLLFVITMFLWVAGIELFILGLFAIGVLVAGVYYAAPYLADLNATEAKASNKCPRCGYDIRATPNKCPECGLDVPLELQPKADATSIR